MLHTCCEMSTEGSRTTTMAESQSSTCCHLLPTTIHKIYYYYYHVSMLLEIIQLPNLFIGTPRICNFILLLINCVCSFSKMLASVKFAEVKVLVLVILCEKC